MKKILIISLVILVGGIIALGYGGVCDSLLNKSGSSNGEPGPSNLKGTFVSTTQIDLSWEYSGIMVTEFKIERSTNGVNFTQIVTFDVQSLPPPWIYSDTTVTTTTYYYRIRGYSDRNGNTNYSATLSVSPIDGLPVNPIGSPTCTTYPADNISGNSAKLHGMVNPNGLDTNAYFQWGLAPSFGNTTTSQPIGNGTTGVAVSATVNGLALDYGFRVVGTNTNGTAYGNSLIITTGGD